MAEKTPETEILRNFLQAAMDAENYEKARQYMYLIEYIEGDFNDDNTMMV